MIPALVILVMAGFLTPIVELLPTSSLGLPDPSGVAGFLADLDTLFPVLGPLRLLAVLMLGLVPFLVIRLIFVVRHFLLP